MLRALSPSGQCQLRYLNAKDETLPSVLSLSISRPSSPCGRQLIFRASPLPSKAFQFSTCLLSLAARDDQRPAFPLSFFLPIGMLSLSSEGFRVFLSDSPVVDKCSSFLKKPFPRLSTCKREDLPFGKHSDPSLSPILNSGRIGLLHRYQFLRSRVTESVVPKRDSAKTKYSLSSFLFFVPISSCDSQFFYSSFTARSGPNNC